ncbi:XPG/Rad2 endonuclease protein [Dioscorea alata]|uniref:XPG/Rad2 endonuclease protein n=1 Tax=Dioscorea alata TaxID=55571 RepID=A0ACB7V7Q7_DIOAL|nr:XPG/Rad2 endonuclease protein [Dioscorea alata]
MGVKNLWDILESCKKTLPLHHLQNKRLCVDLSCWLIQFQNANKSSVCIKDKLYLRSLFHRLRALIALNCSLIFVTDGAIPSIKLSTYRRRLGAGPESTREEANPQTSQTVASLRRNASSEFSCMIKEAKALGLALGIPCLDGIEEAEAQCALLNAESLCDGCFSSDSDIFLFGARTVYRDVVLGDGGHVSCYEMVDIESKLGLGRNSLITLALLLGGDYSQRVHGFGPDKALQVVKSMGDDNVLQQIISEGLTGLKKRTGTKKMDKHINRDKNKENDQSQMRVNSQNQGLADQFCQVIKAYLKPKCHSADSEAVLRVCSEWPFQRTQIQHICEQYFGWNPEKTDEYIIPKIAERDLRRFANLRLVSSELGARIPFHKLPVTCPVSTIVKQRKLQGQVCFEVSWQNMDGIQASIVPADLLESACPEMISEFMARKDEEKKCRNRRLNTRKSNKASINEVEAQLQSNTSISIDSVPSSSSNFHHSATDTKTSEIIDLCSPSPPHRLSKVAEPVDVIEIYDSEAEMSTEHQRKARNLRLFLDDIRNELH